LTLAGDIDASIAGLGSTVRITESSHNWRGLPRVGVVIAAGGKIKEWHERVDARAWPAAVVATL